MQEFLTIQKSIAIERSIVRLKAKVEAIGTFRLLQDTGSLLDLHNTFYDPIFSQNLISLPRLDLEVYAFNFKDQTLVIYKNASLIMNEILCDGLYKLHHDSSFSQSLLSLHVDVGTQRSCNSDIYFINVMA